MRVVMGMQGAVVLGLAVLTSASACSAVQSTRTSPQEERSARISPAMLPGWHDDRQDEAWPALLQTCRAATSRPRSWGALCADALARKNPTRAEARRFFESWFEIPPAGTAPALAGKVTGYYEPVVAGSLSRTNRYRYPVYGAPLNRAAPSKRRGRFPTRAEIDGPRKPLAGREIVWLADPLDRYFLQVEGSGSVRLPDGSILGLDYAAQNGHPFRPIGRVVADLGAFPRAKASMQKIRQWLHDHPDRIDTVLASDPSYVFFERRRTAIPGALGSLGTVLTPRRSIAVDPRHLPLGSVAWLETTVPGTQEPLRSLVFAQDTGGAIKGPGRVDLYWGIGDEAAHHAGLANEQGRLRVLVPRSQPLRRDAEGHG